MKKLFSLLLVAAMILSFAGCAEKKGVLKVGMECNYTPFNWTQAKKSDTAVALTGGGYADGYDVQVAKKIAEGLGLELQIVKMEWDGLQPALEAGTIDAIIAGMSPTAERKTSIDFSEYYYQSDLVIVIDKESKYKDAAQLSDFSGAKVTGQLNTFHYKVVDQITGVKKQTAMADFSTMINALKAGTIDGYVSELPGALAAIGANSDLAYVQFAEGKGFTFTSDEISISVGLKKGSDMTAKINEILKGISVADRETMMKTAIANQPISE